MKVSSEFRARFRAIAEAPLSREEWVARAQIPISADEMARAQELIHWFQKRYPTPAQRLAYVRRAFARWSR